FNPYGRDPRGQHFAHALDKLEEVVRPVDLVDEARLRVAHDKARSVNPPWAFAFRAHDAFGEVLGAKVGVVELLGLLEHVLAEGSLVQSRGGNRAHVVKATCGHYVCKADGVARAVDVGDFLRLGAGVDVVDSRKMEDVLDLPFEP